MSQCIKSIYDSKMSWFWGWNYNNTFLFLSFFEIQPWFYCWSHIKSVHHRLYCILRNISVQQPPQTHHTATRFMVHCSCGVLAYILWVDLFIVCSGYPWKGDLEVMSGTVPPSLSDIIIMHHRPVLICVLNTVYVMCGFPSLSLFFFFSASALFLTVYILYL